MGCLSRCVSYVSSGCVSVGVVDFQGWRGKCGSELRFAIDAIILFHLFDGDAVISMMSIHVRHAGRTCDRGPASSLAVAQILIGVAVSSYSRLRFRGLLVLASLLLVCNELESVHL